jgi:hypothetical protein
MNKLKDVLHLYLGCPCKGDEGDMTYTLVDVGIDRSPMLLDKYGNECVIFDFKPILRPLSSMTEEEKLFCGFSLEAAPQYYVDEECFSFKQVKYLLSKHFDLFNLIGEGLAIDTSNLKVTHNE